MWIMVVYTLIVLVGETVTIAIGLVLDRIFPAASLTVSLTLLRHPLARVGPRGAFDGTQRHEERKARSLKACTQRKTTPRQCGGGRLVRSRECKAAVPVRKADLSADVETR